MPTYYPTKCLALMGDRGDGRPTDTTLLNALAPVLVAHGLLTHCTTKLPSPVTKRTKIDTRDVYPGVARQNDSTSERL
ncbi:hypothetical protein PoB_001743300 [Plakobranchus ocellatus]|uniref:Uncharacterized protein n=1 Tax=Plakobranchus ocellatus TaxID=259542 RepID=A0AAV3Z8F8_9GAST|nr:hypothetical protein PoB_001743300 [Plakobranchus ocellatus]